MTSKTITIDEASNPQVKEYVSAVKRGSKGWFVVPTGGNWYVINPHRLPGKPFGSKAQAIRQAKRDMKGSRGEVFVFTANGSLASREEV